MVRQLGWARRSLALWRYGYTNVRAHALLGNKTPVKARPAIAQTGDKKEQAQTRKLLL